MASSCSNSKDKIPSHHHQVFINFRGSDVRQGFLSHLTSALKSNQINVFIDDHEDKGTNLDPLHLKRIEEASVALAIFSARYTESSWCLRELAKIKECEDEGKLVAIPIFYKLEPDTVRDLRGQFGHLFKDVQRGDGRKKEVIPEIMGFTVHDKR